MIQEIQDRIRQLGDKSTAQFLQGFFKTGPGQYGAGDVFRGVRVPVLRQLARVYQDLPVEEAAQLLRSAIHEERLLALLILIRIGARGDEAIRKRLYELYLKNTRFISNWDLVDGSAEHLVGAFLMNRSRKPLYRLAKSAILWERRIAIMATFHFIRRHDFADTLGIAERLLADPEELIHKAVGWMLREVGKRNQPTEEAFLRVHYRNMPRTMLRYAIERFAEPQRRRYLKGEV